MSYPIVYSSRTGNTALLAQAIREALPQEECSYFGAPHAEASRRYHLCGDSGRTRYLRRADGPLSPKPDQSEGVSLRHGRVWRCARLLEQILGRVKENLASGVQVVGTYMCQARCPRWCGTLRAMEDSPGVPYAGNLTAPSAIPTSRIWMG